MYAPKFVHCVISVQLRVRHYYEYRWYNVELDRSGFLNDLSDALHRDIAMYMHKDMVTSVPLFVGISPAALSSIVCKLKSKVMSHFLQTQ